MYSVDKGQCCIVRVEGEACCVCTVLCISNSGSPIAYCYCIGLGLLALHYAVVNCVLILSATLKMALFALQHQQQREECASLKKALQETEDELEQLRNSE